MSNISRACCPRQSCDGTTLLTLPKIKTLHWADHWQKQACAAMLVIRTSDREIRWM